MSGSASQFIDTYPDLPPAVQPTLSPPLPVPAGMVTPPGVPPQSASPPSGVDPGALLAALASGAGNVAGGVLQALQLPQTGVQTILGNLMGGGGQQGYRGAIADFTDKFERGQLQGGQAAALGGTPIGLLHLLASQGVPVAGGLGANAMRIGAELGTDPLSYVGLGLPAKLARLASASHMSPAVIKTLQGLARADDLTQKTLMLPFDLAGKGVRRGLNIPLPTALSRDIIDAPAGPGAPPTMRKAATLWEYLTATSKESAFKGRLRNMVDAYSVLRGKGNTLEDIVADSTQKAPAYTNMGEAAATLQAMEKDIIDALDQAPDLRVRVAGLDAIAEAHKRIGEAAEKAWLPVQEAIARGESDAVVTSIAQAADKQFFSDGTRILSSAQDVINRGSREAGGLISLTPTQASKLDTGIAGGQAYLKHQLDSFYRRAGAATTDPFVYTRMLRERGERFSRDIGNLTGRLRTELANAGGVPGMSVDEVSRLLSSREEQIKLWRTGTPGFVAELPDELRSVMAVEFPNLQVKLRQVVQARGTIERATKAAWDQAMPGIPMPAIDYDDLLGSISGILQQAGLTTRPLTATPEVLERLAYVGTVDSRRIQSVRNAIKQFPGGDLLATDPFELVLDRVGREMAGTFGISESRGLTKILGDMTAFYKEQALLSGNYPLSNLAGGLFAGGLRGVNPLRVLRGIEENLGRMARGEPPRITTLDAAENTYGFKFGEGVRQMSAVLESTAADRTRDYLKRGVTASQRIGGIKLGVAGGSLGAISGNMQTAPNASPTERAGNIAAGATMGAVGGGIMPFVSKKILHDISGAIEYTMRGTAATQAAVQHMAQQGPRLAQIVNDAIAIPRVGLQVSPKGKVVNRISRAYDPGDIAALQSEIAARIDAGAAIRPDELETLLTVAGVPAERAKSAGNAWQEIVHEASRVGTDFANEIHFDYQNLNNFEQFLKTVVPFSTWAAKAIPFYVEELTKHPLLINAIVDINNESRRHIEEQGLTGRFTGALPVDFASGIYSTIIGHRATPWLDPTRSLLPFSGAARQFGVGTEDDPLVKQALNKLAAIGPGPHPLIELGLRATGLLGKDEPARGYLRWGAPGAAVGAFAGLNRGQGIDLNAPIQEAENMVRRGGGQDPANIRESLASRRIDELALANTGKNIRSGALEVGPYVQAKTSKMGPIWEQAIRDVSRERGAQSLSGFGFSMLSPQAALGEEEATIREAQKTKIVPKELADTVRHMAEQSPTGLAPSPVVDQVRAAAQAMADRNPALGGQIPPVVDMILTQAPTAKNLQYILSQITEAQAELENPAIQGYQGGGAPTEQQLSNLLSQYNNVGALTSDLPPEGRAGLANMAEVYSHPALKASGVGGMAMRDLKNRKDAFRAANPLLDQYLNYQAMKKGQGTVDDFVNNWYGKQAIPAPTP